MFRAVFWSVDNHFTRQYNPEDSSEHHTRRRENLKSHKVEVVPKRDGKTISWNKVEEYRINKPIQQFKKKNKKKEVS
jgi:hypothetical protein